jgi:hypothetical protein
MFPRDMFCLRNISVDTLHKEDTKDIFIIVIIILGVSFMRDIYTYIPETNHVHRERRVATIVM